MTFSQPYPQSLVRLCAESLAKLYPLEDIRQALDRPWGTANVSDIRFRGAAADMQTSDAPEIVLTGAAGTGKTLACLVKVWRIANEHPGARIALVRKTRASMTDTVLVTLERDVIGMAHPLVAEGPRRAHRGEYRLDNGSEITLKGMDKPGRLLSSEFDLACVTQAEELEASEWEILSTRLRSRATPYRQMIGDCNPEHPSHWLRGRADAGLLELWETTHRDNPALWDGQAWTAAGQEYIARLDRLTGTERQRLRYGLWTYPEGAIFDVYDEDRHQVEAFDVPMHWPRFVGVDPLGARVAAIWAAWDPQGQALHVYREYYVPFGASTPDHVQAILRASTNEPVMRWFGGAKSERQIRTDWEQAGLAIEEPPIVDVWSGIDRIYQLLQDNALYIHDSCPSLLTEIGSYRRKVKDGQPTEDIEGKDQYHLIDSLRYMVVGLVGMTQQQYEVVHYSLSRGIPRGY